MGFAESRAKKVKMQVYGPIEAEDLLLRFRKSLEESRVK